MKKFQDTDGKNPILNHTERRDDKMTDKICEEILNMEKKLLQSAVRSNPEELSKILSDDFTEFCSSGKIYKYRRGDTFSHPDSPEINYKISDFNLKKLSIDTYLAFYTIELSTHNSLWSKKSNRSSIWHESPKEGLKLVFHQGTSAQF